MRGPMMMAVAVVALFGSSLLVVHLRYLRDAPTIAMAVPSELPSLAQRPPTPAAPGLEAAPTAGLGEGMSDPSGSLDIGVAPIPAPSSEDWDRRVNECVERNVRGRGYDDVKPALPGRWPALKRAREDRRLLRLAARASCEQELTR